MHEHDLVALTTLSSIFRVAVEDAYASDEQFHQTFAQTTPSDLLQELLELDARINGTGQGTPDYSRNYYISVLAFNEKFMSAYAKIIAEDDLKALLPAGQGSEVQREDFTSLGCPALARLFAPRIAA